MSDNKPHGFDVQDQRLGGLIKRVKHQKDILNRYISDKFASIPELEEDILPFNRFDADGYYFNSHLSTYTTNVT